MPNIELGSKMYAIRSEDHHTAHALLDEGADVDTCNEEIGWYLHHKAFQTDSSSPNDCTYPGPNSKDDLGDDPFCPQFGIGITPLQIAILLGNQTLVNLLLENKANVHPAHEYSPLVTASWLGFGGIVTLLLRKGADINVGDDNVGMPLQAAAAKGHIEIVNLLLENGADIDETSDPYGTALTAASWHNHIDIVKLLLANLASVNSLYGVSDDFRSPLAAAAERGNLQVVELLLAKDASDYVEENTHDSAIWLACMSRTNLREPILHLLFERVINTNVDWSELGFWTANPSLTLFLRTRDLNGLQKLYFERLSEGIVVVVSVCPYHVARVIEVIDHRDFDASVN
ncbi:ankyrin [Penicillium canescens]|nr:ankyrin [Penicillium canescens]